ncbi:isopentenyl-diphosphate delta-isomerase [Monaibacterium marinum]|uniref:Isopentenyl-diphosphate Delta-isomerase n=1 Tax=Pontivivens marinum TaxID=1690039 RepID=A0A2C9CUB7_9RHOB|nr:isopentenyl-diphosphate Delta-isomerase [Monaibacterium marinum]SOH95111.1 isopentenyl-diphosphate delta-isomerase [Monaibacterium marinum]
MATTIPAWVNGVLQPVEKLEVHKRGLRHLAVSVFLTNGGKILLQRRALGKYHTPGLWANTCCTHPAWGEAAMDCATRRLDEELGIQSPELTHVKNVEYRADVGNELVEHEVVDIFTGHAPMDLKMRLNPSEVMETRWVSLRDLNEDIATEPEKYSPWLRIYLAEHGADILRR